MTFGTAIVAIVMILAISVLMMQRAENRKDLQKHNQNGADNQRLEQERDDARQELAELRERVKVLERIATDPARRTAEEIEKLRDE